MGRATATEPPFATSAAISIHALRGEGDGGKAMGRAKEITVFQSTPSVGRATPLTGSLCSLPLFQSTPSVGRATKDLPSRQAVREISIHALRGEGDDRDSVATKLYVEFQSTPSVGRATIVQGYRFPNIIISIHALRGEGDLLQQSKDE